MQTVSHHNKTCTIPSTHEEVFILISEGVKLQVCNLNIPYKFIHFVFASIKNLKLSCSSAPVWVPPCGWGIHSDYPCHCQCCSCWRYRHVPKHLVLTHMSVQGWGATWLCLGNIQHSLHVSAACICNQPSPPVSLMFLLSLSVLQIPTNAQPYLKVSSSAPKSGLMKAIEPEATPT